MQFPRVVAPTIRNRAVYGLTIRQHTHKLLHRTRTCLCPPVSLFVRLRGRAAAIGSFRTAP